MIFSKETLQPQLEALIKNYPELEVASREKDKVILSGNIFVHLKHCDYRLKQKYAVEITVPLYSEGLPFVVDKEEYISKKYPHLYKNGRLCLETDTAVRFRFADGFDLVSWMKEYVEIYFFSYEYFMKYHTFPFGDRSHGIEGVLQTYMDILNTKDYMQTFEVMSYVSLCAYRGHVLCPCGSDIRLRDCHGDILLSIFKNPKKIEILKNDYNMLNKELMAYRRNLKQTKRS